MTKTSATSSSPALLACMASPQPGVTTTTVVSAADAMSTSICPTPTVSTMTTPNPAAPSRRMASGTAREPAQVAPGGHRADEHGRVEGVLAHTHPVAQDGASAEGRRRVHGQHRHLRERRGPSAGQPPLAAVMSRSVMVDLPAPGRAGQADG